jgi:hypothetical protein
MPDDEHVRTKVSSAAGEQKTFNRLGRWWRARRCTITGLGVPHEENPILAEIQAHNDAVLVKIAVFSAIGMQYPHGSVSAKRNGLLVYDASVWQGNANSR